MKRLALARVGAITVLAGLAVAAPGPRHAPGASLAGSIDHALPLSTIANPGGTVTLTIPVSPVADRLVLGSPATAVRGSAFAVTLTAEDKLNQTAVDYRDTVHFTSSDPIAVLPADYTFVPGPNGDKGQRQFSLTLNTGGSQTITATDTAKPSILGTGTIIVTPVPTSVAVSVETPVQYSDHPLIGATVSPFSVLGSTPAGSVTFSIAGLVVSTVQLGSGANAYIAPAITLAPGSYPVTAAFTSTNPFFQGSAGSSTLTVTPEDARVFYTGSTFVNTSCFGCSTATVTLSTTIKDITALPSDPAFDAYPGDIRRATVSFRNRATNAALCSATVVLLDNADTKVGTALCNWTATIGATLSQTIDVATVVGDSYLRNDTSDDQLVTVSQPVPRNFITGGGYLKLATPGGACKVGVGSNANFGFNAHYGSTAPFGQANLILRSPVSCTSGKAGPRVYQVRGSSVTSLNVTQNRATVYFKTSLIDVTNPSSPITLDSSATLKLDIVDNGNPGTLDLVGVTVWRSTGALWFASDWNGSTTIKNNLAGGNVVIH